jgi:hypothetical protein
LRKHEVDVEYVSPDLDDKYGHLVGTDLAPRKWESGDEIMKRFQA